MTDKDKANLAIDLLERASGVVKDFAQVMRESSAIASGMTLAETKFVRVMDVLESLTDLFETGPDKLWFRDYFLLTGEHMVLTEEGWIPANLNTREVTGADPMEVLDEVNAPTGDT